MPRGEIPHEKQSEKRITAKAKQTRLQSKLMLEHEAPLFESTIVARSKWLISSNDVSKPNLRLNFYFRNSRKFETVGRKKIHCEVRYRGTITAYTLKRITGRSIIDALAVKI